MTSVAQKRGVMLAPRFDSGACQLVEGELRLDLLNVWHLTRQLSDPDTDQIIDEWIDPKHLGHACSFGRVDVVEKQIKAGLPLDGEDYGGNPIAAAIEAWVLTPLHKECVERLFRAGAKPALSQFDAFRDAVGSDVDFETMHLVVEHSLRSVDEALRARASEFQASEKTLRAFIGRKR
jgi:hypothetical protein